MRSIQDHFKPEFLTFRNTAWPSLFNTGHMKPLLAQFPDSASTFSHYPEVQVWTITAELPWIDLGLSWGFALDSYCSNIPAYEHTSSSYEQPVDTRLCELPIDPAIQSHVSNLQVRVTLTAYRLCSCKQLTDWAHVICHTARAHISCLKIKFI